MNTATLNTWTLTNSCTCEYYDENEELQPSLECYGCYDDDLEVVKHELKLWAQANNWTGMFEDTEIEVKGSGMGWTRVSGVAYCFADEPDQLIKLLTINGDYRIEFMFSEDYKTLTARRYSHDEPIGTGLFTFNGITK
jgi:hypothetical protein